MDINSKYRGDRPLGSKTVSLAENAASKFIRQPRPAGFYESSLKAKVENELYRASKEVASTGIRKELITHLGGNDPENLENTYLGNTSSSTSLMRENNISRNTNSEFNKTIILSKLQ